MVIIPLVIRLLTNLTPVYILVCLGVFYVSILEGFPTKWSRMRVLSLTCLVNPVVFSIATLIGTIGIAAVFAVWFRIFPTVAYKNSSQYNTNHICSCNRSCSWGWLSRRKRSCRFRAVLVLSSGRTVWITRSICLVSMQLH